MTWVKVKHKDGTPALINLKKVVKFSPAPDKAEKGTWIDFVDGDGEWFDTPYECFEIVLLDYDMTDEPNKNEQAQERMVARLFGAFGVTKEPVVTEHPESFKEKTLPKTTVTIKRKEEKPMAKATKKPTKKGDKKPKPKK